MAISKAYLDVEDLTYPQKHLMCIMGLILPPVPLFLMTGPRYTVRTKEFWVSILLALVFWFFAIVYTVWFIYIGFDEGRKNGYQRVDAEEAVGRFLENEPLETPEEAPQTPTESSSHDAPEAALPSYDESELAHPLDKKTPLGDHKIQH